MQKNDSAFNWITLLFVVVVVVTAVGAGHVRLQTDDEQSRRRIG